MVSMADDLVGLQCYWRDWASRGQWKVKDAILMFCKVAKSRRAYLESECRRPLVSSTSLRDNVQHFNSARY